jgi:threonine/homoserine/homoserine lactone efflux protein
MPEVQHLLWFIAAGWLLNLTPGPDVLYIVSNALRHGARAGLVAGLGITAGCFVHIGAAAVGVSALLAASATAFTLLKLVGATYLVWIGVRMLFSRVTLNVSTRVDVKESSRKVNWWGVFLGGFWTNALNPKVALFFLAFVPQFIAPAADNKALVFVLLGVLFNINSIPINSGWALLAAWTARRVDVVQRGLHWLDRLAGVMFIGFGWKLALTDNPAT